MSKIQFRNAAHRDFVLENLDKCKVNDCYHRAFFYVMGISEETRMNIGKMFDFKRDCIIPEGMHGGWQTSGTVKVCHLAFNLWNGFTEEGRENLYTPEELFCCGYALFQHEYSANFLFTLWKRVRKYGAYASGITQNVDDLLQSHTARTMLANSEFIIMLNQASTDRLELAKLLNISDLQMSYITNVEAGHGLIKVGSSLVPFANKFPKNTKLYKLMTTKPGEA